MKTYIALSFIWGVLVGVLIAAAVLVIAVPGLLLTESPSPMGLAETVTRISENARAEGWTVLHVTSLDEAIAREGGPSVLPVRVLDLLAPDHAGRILGDDESRAASAMLPATIAVYEKGDGKTYVGTINAALLGHLFGGPLSDAMGGLIAEEHKRLIRLAD